MNAVGCLGACFVADETLENLPLPKHVGQTKVGGIDFNQPRMRRVGEAVLALSPAPTGFTASELARKVRAMSGEAESAYGPRAPPTISRNCGAKEWFARSGPHAATSQKRAACGQSPRWWSPAKRSSGRCWPPATGPVAASRIAAPNRSRHNGLVIASLGPPPQDVEWRFTARPFR